MRPSLPAFCSLRILGIFMTLAVVGGALTGCGVSVGGLRGGEEGTVVANRGSIVLLRLLTAVDFLGNLQFGTVVLRVESIETGEQTTVIRPRSPTPEAAQQGWVYLVLAPGRYYVRTQTRNLGPLSGRFLLSVPPGRAMIYAGSLPIACRERTAHQVFVEMTTAPICSLPAAVTDESELAVKVSQASFAQYGPLATILMKGPQ